MTHESPARDAVEQFRKKPVVIDAVQFTGRTTFGDLLDFFGDAPWEITKDETLAIPTLEGVMTASRGDWIIKGVKGEFYPCKPDIFAATYEPAALTTPSPSSEYSRGVEDAASLLDRFVTPFGRAGSQPDAIEGQMYKMAAKVRALSPPPAQPAPVGGENTLPDNSYTPYGRRSAFNLAKLLGISETEPTVTTVINRAYDEIVFLRALAQPVQDDLSTEAAFLCARLRDFECEQHSEEDATQFHGHVLPSVARLEEILGRRAFSRERGDHER